MPAASDSLLVLGERDRPVPARNGQTVASGRRLLRSRPLRIVF